MEAARRLGAKWTELHRREEEAERPLRDSILWQLFAALPVGAGVAGAGAYIRIGPYSVIEWGSSASERRSSSRAPFAS